MIVRNWMQANPMVVSGDTLLSEAKRVLTEHNLHGLPVVDGGRLRGLITRANCLRAAHFAPLAQQHALVSMGLFSIMHQMCLQRLSIKRKQLSKQ